MTLAFRAAQSVLTRWNRALEGIRSRYWSWLVSSHGACGEGLLVKRGAFFSLESGARLELGRGVVLAEGAAVYVGREGRLRLGDGVFVGRGSVLVANLDVELGRGTQVAHYTTIIDTDHRFDRTDIPLAEQGGASSPIRIGEECWIGAQAIVLRGRVLGDRCVVGGGAVVTSDVPSGAVAVGNPARVSAPASASG